MQVATELSRVDTVINPAEAFKAHTQSAHCAATKAAVFNLTKSSAQEVGPASMVTDKARQADFLDELAAAGPLERGGEPRETAEN